MATPHSIAALLGPNPRVIADDIWAKLLWAGLNLQDNDLPVTSSGQFYPLELVRAVTITWLFAGLRSNETVRLRTGCVRWQHDNTTITADSDEVLARDAVCLLDVPTNKTATAFTKPVDPILGQAIETWQNIRPEQPRLLDRRTGEQYNARFGDPETQVVLERLNAPWRVCCWRAQPAPSSPAFAGLEPRHSRQRGGRL